MPSQDKLSPESGDFELFWWPGVEALEVLEVEDDEEGFVLSAPDGTLCSDWLAYWSETPEREAIFSREFQRILLDHANQILEQNGESTITDRQNDDPGDPQEVSAGSEQAD
jgi:hypothetical protein